MQRYFTRESLFRLARAGLRYASAPMVFMAVALLLPGSASAQLSGTYTICKSGCDYSDFSAAVSALKSSGVNGAVTFNVAAESFNETITINNISGSSATNTITFKGAGQGSTRLYYSGTNTVYLSSARYIHFEDMTIENNRSSSTRRAVYMSSGRYNEFRNCHLYVPSTSSSGYVVYITGSSSYNEFHNNRIEGGYYGVYSSLSTSYSYGYNKFVENDVRGFYYYGFIMYYSWKNEYLRNNIDSAAYSYAYGLYSYREGAPLIEGNRIPGYNMYYGIRVYYPNYYDKKETYKVYNNMIGGSTANLYYGIYDYSYGVTDANIEYYHNTIEMPQAKGFALYIYNYSGAGKRYIKNNMLTYSNSSGTALGLYVPSSTDEIYGNNYYNTGGNLIYYNASYYSDLKSYLQAASNFGHGEFDQSVAPEYVSADDLHWDPSKPAPYGKFAGLTTDYDGDTRCNLFPTAGADENNFGKSKPVVKIFGNSSVIQGTPTVFYNSAKASEPKVHAWYIDGVYQTDSIHMETTKLSGPTHTIKLVTEGCGGKDSATFNVSVQLPSKAPVSDFIADKNSVLMGATINFFDLSINGPSQWDWKVSPDSTYDFGMKTATIKLTYGDLSSPKWQAKFNYPGKYEVCLTASNSKGKGNTECKTDYIEVMPIRTVSTGTTVIKDAKGFLYDDGGPNGSPTYNYNNSYSAVIDPCADSVYLVITDFELYCNYDYLQIYEGKDASGKVLHKCTGNTGYYNKDGYTGSNQYSCANDCRPSKTDTFKAKGSMYILLDIKSGVQQAGFEAYWWSKPKNQAAPVAKFSSVDTICTNGVVTFTNETVGDEVSYTWDLDGDPSFYEASSKNTNWPYFFPGQYTVTMIAQNCGGMDTFTKVITVLDPPTPAPDFKADNTNPTTNDIVYFSSTTEECVDDYEWVFTKKHGTGTVTYVNGTGNSSVAPQVVFPDTGLWHVEFKATNVTGTGTEKKDNYINVKGSYCNPSVSNVLADVGISKVVFNEINNSSTQGIEGYQNFTPTVSTTIEIGVKYTLTVERTSNKNKANRTVWMDWNGDGDFDDAQEQVADQNNSSALSWSEDITVPSFAATGATKMRIAINQANYANKVCGQNEFGEYEDYRIYITPDLTAPVITMKGMDTVKLEQGYAYTDSGATAVDNLDGDITADIVMTSAPTFNELIPNTYVFTYNVKDNAGNEAKPKKRVVIITPDVTPPALRVELPETLTVAVNEQYLQPKVISADDLVDGDMTGNVSINDPVNPGVVGTYVVSYTTMDLSNNDTTVTRVVKVIDSIAPTMDLIGADTVQHDVNTTYTDAGVILADNYYTTADLNANLTTSNNVDETKLGTYIVSYVLNDPSGNGPVTVQRVVEVVDREAPVLTMYGDTLIELEVFKTYDDLGIEIADNYYTITAWDTAGTFYQEFPDGKTNKLGMYTIIYEVTDGSGNMSTITRYIEVEDNTEPEISIIGDPSVTVCRWEDYQDGGYDLSDNYWAENDITVTTEGSFVTNGGTDMPGFYSLRYKAVDNSGNVSYSKYRLIYVMSENDPQCVSGIAGNDLSDKISIYPNPNSGKFNVTTELPGTDRVRISITNALGQEVAVISNGALGSNTFTVDLSTQADGIYTLRVVSNDNSVTKQIVISK